jgi:cytochrome b subunit of formate dehydrogenase
VPSRLRITAFWLLVAIFTLGAAGASVLGAEVSEADRANRRCLNCHGQEHIAELNADERAAMVRSSPQAPPSPAGGMPGIYLPPNAMSDSVHAGLLCVDCHRGADQLPHKRVLDEADCRGCHADAVAGFGQGKHGDALEQNLPLAPDCATCHGGHDIRQGDDRKSKVHPLNVIALCADCHEQHQSTNPNGTDAKHHVENYLESVHGQAVMKSGLAVAATCVDCHSAHMVLPESDPKSTVHRDHVPQTCGTCHIGVAETYMDSIHGQRLLEDRPDAPVCTDCHTAHAITRTTTPGFMLDLVNECGSCHDKPPANGKGRSLYETYRLSYHGQVTQLGLARAARCSDCHGAHDVLPAEDPQSRVHQSNLIDTCASCHEGANANFVKFDAHADYRDGERYPILHAVWLYFIVVMSGAFGFFGVHSILWFIRSLIIRVKHGAPKHDHTKRGILRFTALNRINHALVIITFFGLTLTGMPLLFSDQAWAKVLAGFFGGPVGAGILHRVFAVMLGFNFVLHFVGMYRRWKASERPLRKWLFGPNTIFPCWKDVTDCLGMIRWFFKGGKKPAFNRWTYWEKFDYWSEIFGTMIIGGSGLLLWFPAFFSNFLPGWLFNVAMIVHGYEALLAVGFIFTIHFFNAHLRWEKFPVDDVMFTGQLPEDEFEHERGMEYARLQEQGKLESRRVDPPPKWMRPVAVSVGIVAMMIGTTIVVLIILAGLGVL